MKIRLMLAAAALQYGCTRLPEVPSRAAAESVATPSDVVALSPSSPKLARLRVEAVAPRDFPAEELSAPGKVELNPGRVARVLMPVPGRIRRVLVKLGDAVPEGQPLLAIDSAEAAATVAGLRQAEAQARQAETALRKARTDAGRLKDLYEHRAAALKDLQNAEHELAQAQAGLEQAQSARDAARQRLALFGLKPDDPAQDVVVRAPIAGKVLELAVAPGEYRNDTSAPLMVLADLSTVWITSDVPESLIRKVTPGESVQVELAAYPGEVFRGRVTRIADMVDPQSRTIKVQAEIANAAGRLRPEMFGQIRHSHGMERLPAVPVSAVLQREGRDIVMVEEQPGRFRQVAVVVGARSGDWLAARSGVRPGDRVVVDGALLLRQN